MCRTRRHNSACRYTPSKNVDTSILAFDIDLYPIKSFMNMRKIFRYSKLGDYQSSMKAYNMFKVFSVDTIIWV